MGKKGDDKYIYPRRTCIHGTDEDANNYVGLKFSSTNELQVTMKHTSQTGGSSSTQTRRKITKQRFEDSSAWYHILVNFDAANQNCDLYVNGERINKFSTNEQPQNYDFAMSNGSVPHYIGHCPTTRTSITASTFNGVMSDVYFIDVANTYSIFFYRHIQRRCNS